MRLLPIVLVVLFVSTNVHSDEIKMTGGDVLHGRVIETTDDLVVLMHDVLGRVAIPRSGVAAIRRDDPHAELAELDPALAAQLPQPDAKPSEKAAVDPEDPNAGAWKKNINVGWDLSTGNTEESKWSIGFEANYLSPITRARIDGRYYYKTTDSETTDNKFNVTTHRDWLRADSKWFSSLQGTYDNDQFESWRHRVSGHYGPGYHMFKNDDLYLDFRGGLGAKKEWGSESDSVKFEGRTGLELGWEINERQQLRLNATVFPVLDDFSDVRTLSVVSWRFRLDNETPLSLTLRFTHEYQAIVDPGKDKHDLRVLLGLSLDF